MIDLKIWGRVCLPVIYPSILTTLGHAKHARLIELQDVFAPRIVFSAQTVYVIIVNPIRAHVPTALPMHLL